MVGLDCSTLYINGTGRYSEGVRTGTKTEYEVVIVLLVHAYHYKFRLEKQTIWTGVLPEILFISCSQ